MDAGYVSQKFFDAAVMLRCPDVDDLASTYMQ